MSVDEHVGRVQPVAAIFCVLGIASVVTVAVAVTAPVVVVAVVRVLLVPEHQCGRHGVAPVSPVGHVVLIAPWGGRDLLPNPVGQIYEVGSYPIELNRTDTLNR